MSHTKPQKFVPLSQSGIAESALRKQLDTICRSDIFRGNTRKLLQHVVEQAIQGREPTHREIAEALFNKPDIAPGDSQVRTETGKLRKLLTQYYAQEAKPGEIKFSIPDRSYKVEAPKRAGESSQPHPPAAAILEPSDREEVHQRVPVRGRIDALNLDWRAWLVVRTPCGDLYPQCRVSRNSPEWEHEVRIGLVQWGADEGAEYEINLVAADSDGDAAFYNYLKSGRDGFGPLLPSDSIVLDAKRITRRDIRNSNV